MLIQAVDSYLDLRRASGFQLRVEEGLLRDFAGASAEQSDPHIRSATAIEWAARAPSARQKDRRLKTVIRFARHVHAEDDRHEIPPAEVFAAPRRRRLPHIFEPEEVAQVIGEAGRLGPTGSLRPYTYRTLFGLVASCGLRISEALALQIDDVTSDGLLIRETKFRKSRLVPPHDSTAQEVQRYLHRRRQVAGDVSHLFVSLRHQPLAYPTTVSTFLAIVRKLGLRGPPGEPGPRLHDLRHTFAVRSLEGCPRDEVASHLLALSTYLGHAKVNDTYWYLQVTPRLMTNIADACRTLFEGEVP